MIIVSARAVMNRQTEDLILFLRRFSMLKAIIVDAILLAKDIRSNIFSCLGCCCDRKFRKLI